MLFGQNFIEIKFNKKTLLNIFFILNLIMILLLIKIYISNKIYHNTVKLNKLLNEYVALKAENEIIRMKINKIKFKNNLNSFN